MRNSLLKECVCIALAFCLIPSLVSGALTYTNSSSLSIPDSSLPVTSQLSVSDVRTITDVNVQLNITHGYIGDLIVSLISPSGTVVILHNRSGSSSNNITATYDLAATPYDSLTLFNNEPSQGIWTLSVQDTEAGDSGTLTSWSLTIEGYESTVYSTVMGTISYEDRPLASSGFQESQWLPVRYAQVELVNEADQSIMGSSVTGEDGSYQLRIPRQGLVDCYLRVYSRVVSPTHCGQVLNDDSSANIYALVSSSESRNTNTNFEMSLGAPYNNGSGLGGVFNILDQVALVQERVVALGESKPPLVSVLWKSGTLTGTYFVGRTMSLYLLGSSSDPDEYDDPVILHELGHYVAAVYSVDTSKGGSHSSSDSHQDLSLAWSEGWANYFSGYMRDYYQYYDSMSGGITVVDLELPSHSATATGQDNESAVQSILWDIYDGSDSNDSSPGTDDDPMDCSCGADSIWGVFSDSMDSGFGGDVAIFESFYEGWLHKYGSGFFKTELTHIMATRSIDLNRQWMVEDFNDYPVSDNSQVTVSFNVSENVSITSVSPFVHIEHNAPSDLVVSLYHPDGTRVILHNRGSGSATGVLTAWYDTYETAPYESLSAFDGKSSQGLWRIVVSDEASNDTGTLKTAKLDIRGTPVSQDLIVSSITGTGSAVAGGGYSVTATIRNQSQTDISSTFSESYYLSADQTITSTDIFLGTFLNQPLASLTSRENTHDLMILSSVSTGNYYLGVIVDWDGAQGTVSEASEINNVSLVPVEVSIAGSAPGIDLQPSQLSASAAATAGATIEASVTLSNSGTEPSGDFVSGWYLSSDTFINSGDDVLLGTFEWSSMAPFTSSSVTRVLTVPAGTSQGNWYVGYISDVNSQVDETDEGNNIAVSAGAVGVETPVEGIDLRAVSIAAPATVAAGNILTVASVVRNSGTSSSIQYIDGYYLSADEIITTTDTYIGSFTGSPLDSGVSENLSRQITIPSSTTLGSYYLGLFVDVLDDVDDSNNFQSTAVEIISPDRPDLVAVNFVAPATMNPGSVANFTHSISNSGPNDSGLFYIDYYLSTDRTITQTDTFLTRIISQSISGNSGGTFTITTSVPSSTPTSTWYIGCIADSTFFVSEGDETNNAISAQSTTIVTLGEVPDLYMTNLTGPLSAAGGGEVGIRWQIHNQGEGATAGGFTNNFYLSDDGLLSGDDILLGQQLETAVLLPGANFARSATFTVPSTVTAAGRYLLATVDASYLVVESNEDNNFAMYSNIIQISESISGIDLRVSNITPPSTAAIGNDMIFEAMLRNDGQTGISVAQSFSTYFYLSSDETISSEEDTFLTSVTTRGLVGAE